MRVPAPPRRASAREEARRLADRDAQLLANRIALLEAEEAKAWMQTIGEFVRYAKLESPEAMTDAYRKELQSLSDDTPDNPNVDEFDDSDLELEASDGNHSIGSERLGLFPVGKPGRATVRRSSDQNRL